jgi:hypothetical protein
LTITFLFLMPALTAVMSTRAADIDVQADQPTIQQGIDAAHDGDRALAAPGTYAEHIDFHGKIIQVIGTGGAAITTIDGMHTGCVVTLQSGESRDAVLVGFAIINGNADLREGIRIVDSSPTIHHNEIRENQGCGGALCAGGISNPSIHHNRVRLNSSGGILVDSEATVDENLVDENGVFFGEVILFDNLVTGNSGDGVYGYGRDGRYILMNNAAADNLGYCDIGIDNRRVSALTMVNNIVRTSRREGRS